MFVLYRLAIQMIRCQGEANISECMTRENITLIQKKEPKRNHPGQLQTDNVSTSYTENPNWLEKRYITRWKERAWQGNKRNSGFTVHLLYESKAIKKNIADSMVPQSWMVDRLRMYQISDKFIIFFTEPWKTGKGNWQLKEKLLLRWKSGEVSFKVMSFHH